MYVARRRSGVGEGGRALFGLSSKGASHVLPDPINATIRNYKSTLSFNGMIRRDIELKVFYVT